MNPQSVFNTQSLKDRMLARLGSHAEAYPSHIAQGFPHILAKLVDVWGLPEGSAYLDSLMVMDRPNRRGFPAEVASEILRLSMIHGLLAQESEEDDDQGWASKSNIEVSDFFGRRGNR